jgi:hypothetical protein
VYSEREGERGRERERKKRDGERVFVSENAYTLKVWFRERKSEENGNDYL